MDDILAKELIHHAVLVAGLDSLGSDFHFATMLVEVWRQTEGKELGEAKRMIGAYVLEHVYGVTTSDMEHKLSMIEHKLKELAL